VPTSATENTGAGAPSNTQRAGFLLKYELVLSNRSVPVQTVLPHIVYDDVAEAIRWLASTFGFSEHFRYGDPADPGGAQIHLGDAWIMLRKSRPGSATPVNAGFETQSLTIFIEDVDSHYERTKLADARIVEDPHVTEYGERQYAVLDFAGHHWLFSRHARDVTPEEWGAIVAEPAVITPQISPMLAVSDGSAAIEFYKEAFDAALLWSLGTGAEVVAGLAIHGAPFFLAHEAPPYGTRGPSTVGFTTIRVELFVDDPVAVHRRAVAAGALERSPVREHTHPTVGPQPISRMLQGSVTDPFGHIWLIGKFLW
jgi:uncharacterized glyoxalase superfamily protein PhnB